MNSFPRVNSIIWLLKFIKATCQCYCLSCLITHLRALCNLPYYFFFLNNLWSARGKKQYLGGGDLSMDTSVPWTLVNTDYADQKKQDMASMVELILVLYSLVMTIAGSTLALSARKFKALSYQDVYLHYFSIAFKN